MRYEAHNLIRDKVHVEQEQPQATTPDDPKSMYYIRLRVAEKAQRIQTTPKQRTHRHKTPVIPRGVFPPVSLPPFPRTSSEESATVLLA